MKLWTWVKTLPLWAVLGAVTTAVFMAMAGAKAARFEKRARNAQTNAENLLQDKTKLNVEKAAKLQREAEKHKEKAAIAKAEAEARIEELGNKNETLDDIADRFNSRRLRKSTDQPS